MRTEFYIPIFSHFSDKILLIEKIISELTIDIILGKVDLLY